MKKLNESKKRVLADVGATCGGRVMAVLAGISVTGAITVATEKAIGAKTAAIVGAIAGTGITLCINMAALDALYERQKEWTPECWEYYNAICKNIKIVVG